MTTIVAVQGDGWAVVGSDSRVTEEDGRVYVLPKGSSKVARNRAYLLGAAGDVRAINILQHAFRPPDAKSFVGSRLDKFITSDFVPALRACFNEQGYGSAAVTKDQSDTSGSVVLAAINGSVYVIGEDYAWVKDSSGIYGLGSGSYYALGVLYALLPEGAAATDLDKAKAAVRTALGVAARLDAGTSAPFIVQVQSRPV